MIARVVGRKNVKMRKQTKKQVNRAPEPATPSLNTSSPAAAGPGSPKTPPTRGQIQKRAYELYLAGGSLPGHDMDYWLQAERELS